MSHSPGIEALKAETPPGRCICCEGLLPQYGGSGRHRVKCDDRDCLRLYHVIYEVDRQARRKTAFASESNNRTRELPSQRRACRP